MGIFKAIGHFFGEIIGINEDRRRSQRIKELESKPQIPERHRSQTDTGAIMLILAALNDLNNNFKKYKLVFVPETDRTVNRYEFNYKTYNGIPFKIGFRSMYIAISPRYHSFQFFIDDVLYTGITKDDAEFSKIAELYDGITQQYKQTTPSAKKFKRAVNKIHKFAAQQTK